VSIEAASLWELSKYSWTLILAWWYREKIKQDEKIEQLKEAHSKFITETEAKEMMKQIVQPIEEKQKEMSGDLKNVLTTVYSIKESLAVLEATTKLTNKE
jgi:hypothetical protein